GAGMVGAVVISTIIPHGMETLHFQRRRYLEWSSAGRPKRLALPVTWLWRALVAGRTLRRLREFAARVPDWRPRHKLAAAARYLRRERAPTALRRDLRPERRGK